MVSQINALVGVIATLLIAIYAFRKKQLTEKGVIAAMGVGITLFALGGWTWFSLLALFFISSAAWSKFKKNEKKPFTQEHEKTDVRDAWQVLANSLFAVVLAAIHFLNPDAALFAAFAAAVATVTADTWATEIGILDPNAYSILHRSKAQRGDSGVVSAGGLAAAAGASVFIALSAVLLNTVNNDLAVHGFSDILTAQFVGGAMFVAIVAVAGFFGSVADSWLGATIQAKYECPKCGKRTEQPIHSCGTKAKLVQGFAVIDNDSVNFLASIAGGFMAYVLGVFLF
ncbi:DUF92 domain-containing protein [Candidatus Micrarchaeota archaeon]|nr:DUF92 domain-containing protein [Candidatus Micrarchaeota archaeon]